MIGMRMSPWMNADQHLVALLGHEEGAVAVAGVELAHAAPLGHHLLVEPGERDLDAPLLVGVDVVDDDRLDDAVEALDRAGVRYVERDAHPQTSVVDDGAPRTRSGSR